MKVDRNRYEELSKGKRAPYCFEIRRGKQVLFYFGANHSRDPQNKQYPALKKYWKKFLRTHSTDKVVMVEGRLRALAADEKSAIINGSEGSVVTLFAYTARIPVVCPEPTDAVLDASVQKKFSKDAVQYYHFAHHVDSWRRFNPRPNFDQWMKKNLAAYAQRKGLKDFTLPRMKAVHRKLFRKTFSLKDINFFNEITNPNRTDTIVNRVARTQSDLRDAAILKTIVEEWKVRRSLFIAYGSGHAFLHEPILKKVLKNK